MPRTALHVRTESQVPRVINSRQAGTAGSRVAARCRPVPGMWDRPAIATAANSAYVAATAESKPYRKR